MPKENPNAVRTWPPAVAIVDALDDLVAAAEAHDGHAALSEVRRLELEHPDSADAWAAALADADGNLLGYAQAGAAGTDGTRPVEVVVRPRYRDDPTWGRLLDAVVAADEPSTVWASGEDPARDAALRRRAASLTRELWELRIPLPRPDAVTVPDDVELRSFRPGIDDGTWLRMNNAAFATHPEQGNWTLVDLAARRAQPWFDAEGFLMAWRETEAIGFCWTKVHPSTRFDPRLGEIYVIGVTPDAQGSGLGRVLTLAGLRHLAGRGIDTGMLYVDEDNESARSLYRALGFVEHRVSRGWRVAAERGRGP